MLSERTGDVSRNSFAAAFSAQLEQRKLKMTRPSMGPVNAKAAFRPYAVQKQRPSNERLKV